MFRPSLWTSLTALTFLTACAQAAVAPPMVGRDAVTQEQSAQDAYVKNMQRSNEPIVIGKEQVQQMSAVAKRVQVAGEDVCQHLATNSQSCTYNFTLVTEPAEEANVPNAYADGNTIYITAAMLGSLQNTEQLAFVLSHEYAHNVLTHVSKQQRNVMMGALAGTLADRLLESQGMTTGGQLAKMGGQYGASKYAVSYEREADYVGLYIADRAGYDVTKAEEVWRRIAANNPTAIYTQTTHPTTAERYVAMQEIIREIQNKKKAGQTVLPNRAPDDGKFF